EGHAERVEVGARVEREVRARLLGRHVARIAEDEVGIVGLVVAQVLGDAEVEHLDRTKLGTVRVAADEDVRGLDVAMDDSATMHVMQGVQDLAEDLAEDVERDGATTLHRAADVTTLEELHREPVEVVLARGADVEDANEIGMTETPAKASFQTKAALLGLG